MTVSHSRVLQSVAASVGVAATMLAAPHAASAAASLDYRCDYGASGATTAKIDIAAFTPQSTTNPDVGPSELDVAAFAAPLPSTFLQSWPGAVSVEGTAKATFVVSQGDVEQAQFTSDLAVERADLGGTSVPLYGSGTTPSLTLEPGPSTISAGAIVFHLKALDATGNPIPYSGPDVDREEWVGADGDPSTIDLRCVVDPPTQNTSVSGTSIGPRPYEECFVGMYACPIPEAPTHVRVGGITTTAAELRWTRSETARSEDFGPLLKYEVELDGRTLLATSNRLPLTDLEPGKTYSGTIRTTYSYRGMGGDIKKESTPAPFSFVAAAPKPVDPDKRSYALAGSTSLKTLVRGSLALKGQADLTYGPPANLRTVNGTLDLDPTSGRLVALGFLPVTAKVAFVSSGAATGYFGGFAGSLSLSQKVRIKVLEAKLFGAIPLIGGNNCQTKQLTTLNLNTSTSGTLTGTYAISDLNGCGALNGLVSPLTAGDGNTIGLTLTRKTS